MAQFSAPSFSLGLDDDGDDPPAAPSFSLGLDLDISDLPTEGEEDEPERPPDPGGAESPAGEVEDFEEELDPLSLDPDFLPPADDPSPSLKRLRRGPGLPPRPISTPSAPPPPPGTSVLITAEMQRECAGSMNVDDEIEEFSSQEEKRNRDQCSLLPRHATCSSSKFSLHDRFLTSQPTKKLEDPKVSPAFNASTSKNLGASSEKLFPKLTISPLRKFCLVDSDSDDPSSSKQKYRDNKEVDESQSIRQHASSQSAKRNEIKAAFQQNKVQAESLWKDFSVKESTNLATPVLDEFCEEYFRSVKDVKADRRKVEPTTFISSRILDRDDFGSYHQQMNISGKTANSQNLPKFQPPAYRYFYHGDARIRALVRERFPYFAPIGAENNGGNQQTVENLDYMSQFGGKQSSEGSSKKRGKRPMVAKANASLPATEGWVNPKSSASIPKNAGKRRVRADGEEMGRWFTGEDGRKVYVTKSGQELTGRMAYRQYKKANGGFRKQKPRKKAANKKTAGNKRKR